MNFAFSRSRAKAILILLTILTALSVISVILAQSSYFRRYLRLMLISASTGFLLMALFASISNPSRYSIFALLALAFCWLGDFTGPRNFTLGLVMFLFAHLAFIAAFLFRGIDARRVKFSLPVFMISDIGLFLWLYPSVPGAYQVAVFSYMAVITAMVVLAFGIKPVPGQFLIIIGTVLFYISDIFVARWKFVSTGSINAFFCYPLYYSACMLLALSIFVSRNSNTPSANVEN